MKAEQDDVIGDPPDYSTHQQNNNISIIHELPALQARGVLLIGSVLGAAGLPILSGSSQGDIQGDLSFKILFIEGGSQPAMFRCKTPIYSSDAVAASKNPRWDNGIFHFDMIMPESNEDSKSLYGFVIQGEISITIYQTRISGGNNVIGQASFDLADMVKTGTVEFFQASYEGRSVTGSHILLSRTNEIVGEVDVQLNIAWKSINQATTTTTTTGNENNSSNKATMMRSSTAVASKRLSSQQHDSSTNKASGSRGRTSSNKRPTATSTAITTNVTAATPIKIVSKLQKKQKEDNKRINQENLRMLKLMQHYGNNKDVYSNTKDSNIKAPTTVITQTESKQSRQSNHEDDTNKDNKNKDNNKISSNTLDRSHEYYLNIFNNMKKEIRLETQENDKLKSRLSTLKINVNKAELSINKIKGGYNSTPDSKRGSTGNSIISNRNSSSNINNKIQFESNFMNNLSMEADAKDDSIRQISDMKDDLKPKQNIIIPVVTPLTDNELVAMNVNDGEYRSLAEEYNVLQSVRRGLMDRLIIAKKACKKADNTQSSISERTRFLQRRLSYLQDIVGETAVSVALSLVNCNSSNSSSGGGGRPKGDDDDDAMKRISSPQVVELIDKNDDDYLLFDRLRGAKEQDVLEQSIYESKTHLLSNDSSINELRGIVEYLHEKYDKLKAIIDNYREESKQYQSELYELTKNDRITKMRENIAKMKLRLKMLQLQSKLKIIDEEQYTVDMELTSLRYRQLRSMEALQSSDFSDIFDKDQFDTTLIHKKAISNSTSVTNNQVTLKSNDNDNDNDRSNIIRFSNSNNNIDDDDHNHGDINGKDGLEAKSSSPMPMKGAVKSKKGKKHVHGGARFSDDVVSTLINTDPSVNDQDRKQLYYNLEDEDAFNLQMIEEIDKANELGLSWQEWMNSTEDNEKSTFDLTLTTNPNALFNDDENSDRNLL